MPLNLTNAVATARQLLAYTVEAANFSDKMDVIFVAEIWKIYQRGKIKRGIFWFGFVAYSMSANGRVIELTLYF